MKRDFIVELKVNFEMETPLGFSDCTVSECCIQDSKLRDIDTVERFVNLYKKAITNKKIRYTRITFHYCYFNPHIDDTVYSCYVSDGDFLTSKEFQKTYIDTVNHIIELLEKWEHDGITFVA